MESEIEDRTSRIDGLEAEVSEFEDTVEALEEKTESLDTDDRDKRLAHQRD